MSRTISIHLYAESIALGNSGLLKHQEETIEALKHASIVLNCALTGAGKTKAAHLSIQSELSLPDVLFVAPTNALVAQHFEDARKFVRENALPYKVVAVDGAVLSSLMRTRTSLYRPSAVLHEIIYNPRAFGEELGLDDRAGPLWLITNPDQIWLSIIHGRERDTRNLLKDFINHFRFVVVDEFHYYSAEQLTLFFLCMAFWKHFGQFDDGLKMLLLTATPDETVETFFRRMNFDFAVAGNTDCSGMPSVPVLSPIDLTVTTGSVTEFSDHVMGHYRQGKDGVIISDSLFEINKAFKIYEKFNISVGRITGPIRDERRKQESQKRLILATPTVDLGFNFIRPRDKARQEIDFIVASARTGSAFWQRLGRAGRVLGRKETETPSQAVMLLPSTGCYTRLEGFEGKCMSRAGLKSLLDLRDKKLKGHALTREGLYTSTRQLLEIEKMLPDTKKEVLEKIFATLKNCFDPNQLTPDWPSFRKRHWLSGQFKKVGKEYETLSSCHISQWLKSHCAGEEKRASEPMETLAGAWAKNYFYRKGQSEQYNEYVMKNDRMSLICPLLQKKPSLMEDIADYYREQMLRLDYLFNFRGSSTKEEVWIYDPEHLYSAHLINKTDLITLLSKYHYNPPLSHSAAEKQWGLSLPKGEFFFELTEFQEYPYRPVFQYRGKLPVRPSVHSKDKDPEVLPCYWQTVALHGISLSFENRKNVLLPIPAELRSRLTGLSELFFITPIENRFVLEHWLKEYDVRTGELKADKSYSVVFGKDAIFISEELYFRSRSESC